MEIKQRISNVEKEIYVDVNNHRHIISYKADNTDGDNVKIKELTDQVATLPAPDVVGELKGVITYNGEEYKVNDFTLCDCFKTIVADLKEIVGMIVIGVTVNGNGTANNETQQ